METKLLQILKTLTFIFFRYGGCTWPPEIGKHGFSPEMDVSEWDKKTLKSGAHNFEKQKNDSILNFILIFFWIFLTFLSYMVTPEIRQRTLKKKKVRAI